jgi:hypothetical protein
MTSISPGWYATRPVARLAELGTNGVVRWRTFSDEDCVNLSHALGMQDTPAPDALAFVAARSSVLGGHRMPPGAVMAEIEWVAHVEVPADLTIGATCDVSTRTDSRGRTWVTATVATVTTDGHPLADFVFRFLWPQEAASR